MYHWHRSQRQVFFSAVTVCLAFFMVGCHKNPPVHPGPARTIALNDITVLVMEDSPHTFLSSVFADIDAYPDRKALMPGGAWRALTRTYLVATADRVVLIDSGMGKEAGVDGKTEELLTANGVPPDVVTDILLTHMDIDHISGLIHKGKAVYPRARLHVAKAEYEAWVVHGQDRTPEHIALARRVAAAYAGRVMPFSYGQTLAPGIMAQRADGHTAGHTVYEITSGDRGMVIVGDMLHVAPVQLRHPGYSTIYDANPVLAAQTREAVLSRLSEGSRLMAGMHFEGIGMVRRTSDGGFVIVPE